MDTQSLPFAYDIATMALKGRRFREAEEKFKDLAMQTNSVESWCGMAISKYGLIMEDVTISEVFYCFEKAKTVAGEENINDLLSIIQRSSFECASHLYDVYVKAVLATRSAVSRKNVAMLSTIVGGISTVYSASNNRTIGTIASAGYTAFSYDSYLKSHSSAEELKQVQELVVKLIEEIKESVKIALGETHEKWAEFVEFTETRQQAVIEALKTDDQRTYEKALAEKNRLKDQAQQSIINDQENNTADILMTPQSEQIKYLEEKRVELKDPDHPFHYSKMVAQELFKKRKYRESLKYANLASTYFNKDEEVIAIQDKVIKIRFLLVTIALVPLWIIITCYVGISIKTHKVGLTFCVTGIPFLLYVVWKLHQLKTTTATLAELRTKQITKLPKQ